MFHFADVVSGSISFSAVWRYQSVSSLLLVAVANELLGTARNLLVASLALDLLNDRRPPVSAEWPHKSPALRPRVMFLNQLIGSYHATTEQPEMCTNALLLLLFASTAVTVYPSAVDGRFGSTDVKDQDKMRYGC